MHVLYSCAEYTLHLIVWTKLEGGRSKITPPSSQAWSCSATLRLASSNHNERDTFFLQHVRSVRSLRPAVREDTTFQKPKPQQKKTLSEIELGAARPAPLEHNYNNQLQKPVARETPACRVYEGFAFCKEQARYPRNTSAD